MPRTEEFAKNPIIKAKVKCVPCGKQFDIEEMLREEPMAYPFVAVFEGFLLCPNCGHRTHNYYMSEGLRHDQQMLKKAVMRWQREKSSPAWTEYVRRHRVFQNNFDKTQERYKRMFAKEFESEQATS